MVLVFAYTPPGSAPPFVNISRNDGGEYVITVRDRDGDFASVTLPRTQTTELYRALLRDLMKTENA